MQYLIKYKKIIYIIISLFVTTSLSVGFLDNGNPIVSSNSFIAILFFVMFYITLCFCFVKIDKKKSTIVFCFSFILSIFIFLGAEFSNYQTIFLNWKLIFNFAGLNILLFCITLVLFNLVEDFRLKGKTKIYAINNSLIKKFLIFWLFILIFWFPAFLAIFPGIYSYDASLQVLQIYGGQGLNSHHPVIHTLILNGSIYLGKLIMNNYNCGIAIYAICQAMTLAAVFSYSCIIMIKYRVPDIIIVFSLLFYSLNPINQIWAFVTTKDIFFTAFFILCILLVLDMVHDKNFFNKKSKKYLFIISLIMICLFRNQGIYICCIFGFFAILTLKKCRKKITLHILSALLIVLIIQGPIYNVLNVESGSIREALSVPIQQIARVYNKNNSYFSKEEKELLFNIIPEEYWLSYIPEISDPVKGGFNDNYFSEHIGDFIKIWIKTGWNNKLEYIESFLYGSYGYWYIDSSPRWMTYIWFDGFFMEPEYNILNIQRNGKFPIYEEYLRNISYNLTYEKIPIISVLLNQGFPFWIFLFAIFYLIYIANYKNLLVYTMIIGLWVTLLLGPCICVRYAYPLMASIPIMISTLFFQETDFLEKNIISQRN